MGFNEVGKLCAVCGKQTLHRQKTPNHVLHFLIAFFTCGIWLIVWLMMAGQTNPWLCSICGTKFEAK